MKKIVSLILTLCILATAFIIPAYADYEKLGPGKPVIVNYGYDKIKVFLNGKELYFSNAGPKVINGRTYAHIRTVFEAFGLDVTYDNATGSITAKNESFNIGMQIGSTIVTVNGEIVQSDAAPINDYGYTYVPVAVIAKAIGCNVDWYGSIKTVDIYSPDTVREMTELYNPQGEKQSVPKELLKYCYMYGWNDDINYIGTMLFSKSTGIRFLFPTKDKDIHLADGMYGEGTPRGVYYVNNDYMTYENEQVAASLIAQGLCFDERPVTIYALDGRTMRIPKSQLEAYTQVGWYDSQPVLMYAADGRKMYVGSDHIYEYKEVGWYYGKPMNCYNIYGEYITIGTNDYNEGKGTEYFSSKKEAQKAYNSIGWGQG